MPVINFVINIFAGAQYCFLPTYLILFYAKRAKKQNNTVSLQLKSWVKIITVN